MVWVMGLLLCQIVKRERWIYIKGKLIVNLSVSFVFVYGPNDREGGNIVWNEIIGLKQRVDEPMMVLGDFNEILKPKERKGNSFVSASMRDFQN